MSWPKNSDKKDRTAVSIVIPTYNQANSLSKLLTGLASLAPKDWEIIVVDDGSTDDTPAIIEESGVKHHRFDKNQGPARARNLGAKLAKGEILVFFDADVLPFKNTLQEALRPFKKDPQVAAVSGMWTKTQTTRAFFPQFKALRDWSYFFNEAENSGIYYFTPRVAAIKKSVFLKAGGFNTEFKKADLESLEFSFRLEKLTPIHFNPKFLVNHQFKGGLTQVKNYFKRTFFFLKLFSIHRRFCRTVSTPKEASAVFLAAFSLTLLILGLFLKPILLLFPPIVAFYLYRERKFLAFFFSERGFFFSLKAFFYNYLLHLVIFSAGVFFFITLPVLIFKPRPDDKD